MIKAKTEHTSTTPLTTFQLFIFKQCLKKVIGSKKKSYLIFCLKIIELSVPKILTLTIFMYDLNKREKPRPAEVFSSRAAFFTVNRIMAKTFG